MNKNVRNEMLVNAGLGLEMLEITEEEIKNTKLIENLSKNLKKMIEDQKLSYEEIADKIITIVKAGL